MLRHSIIWGILAALAAFAAWIAATPGTVVMLWHGYRVDTSVTFLLGVMLLGGGISWSLLAFLRLVWRMPKRLLQLSERRRQQLIETSLAKAYSHLRGGNTTHAQRELERVARYAPTHPLLAVMQSELNGNTPHSPTAA